MTDHDHNDKYIVTQELILISENFTAKLKQGHLATKADIVDFLENKDFDDKIKNLNKKFTLNKAKHIEAEKKITDLTVKVAQI